MPELSTPTRKRKLWFIPRISLRFFLVVTTILAIFAGPWLYRTRKQMHACKQLEKLGVSVDYVPQPSWVSNLPQSWINIADGHWLNSIESVYITDDVDDDGRLKLKQILQVIAKLPNVPKLGIDAVSYGSLLIELPDGSMQEIDANRKLLPTELLAIYAPLASINGLQALEISTTQPDQVLAALPDIPELRRLQLGDEPDDSLLRQQSLKTLLKFPRLESFTISSRFVEGNDLSVLASFPNLKEFLAIELSVRHSHLQCFARHQGLERLEIGPNFIDDETLKLLATCPRIIAIRASGSSITDDGLALLTSLKSLEEVDFSHTSISDTGFAHLANCKSLKTIRCRECKLTDAIGPALAQLNKLSTIELEGTLTSKKLLDSIASPLDLKLVHVGDNLIELGELGALASKMPDVTFGELSWAQSLNYLDIAPKKQYTTPFVNLSGIRGLNGKLKRLQNVRGLKHLSLDGSDVTDNDLSDLLNVASLSSLDISNTDITLDGLKLLQFRLPKKLTIGPFENSDAALHIVSRLASLNELKIHGSKPFTSQSVQQLVKSQVKQLSFPDAKFDKTIATALTQMPYLNSLSWSDLEWSEGEIADARLSSTRNAQGESFSLPNYLNTHQQDEVTIVSQAELEQLKHFSLTDLNASGIPLSRSDLAHIAQLNSLRMLDLSNTGIRDDDLPTLGPLPNLQTLNLSNNPLTDSSVDSLMSLTGLQSLLLANTKLTDMGISRILESRNLSELDLSGTSVTAQAWKNLKRKTKPVDFLALKGLANAPDILREIPVEYLPSYVTLPTNFTLSVDELKFLRGINPVPSSYGAILSNEIVSAWSIEHALSRNFPYARMQTHATNRVSDILLELKKQGKTLYEISFQGEQLISAQPLQFPQTLRSIHFVKCTLDTDTLDAIAKLPLRELTFKNCNLEQCSLEPLATIPSLYRLHISYTNLSANQRQTLDRLRHTFDKRSSW